MPIFGLLTHPHTVGESLRFPRVDYNIAVTIRHFHVRYP